MSADMATTHLPEFPAGKELYETYPPIEADDEAISTAVASAELPALLAALALVNNDPGLLADDLKPPLPPMGARIQPQGGLSSQAQDVARRAAATAICAFRDRGSIPVGEPDEALLTRVMKFMTKDAGDEHLPLLRHELGLPEDAGAPTWTKAEVAPDREFRVAIIGAGISGMAAAHRLNQAGLDYVVFEKNPEVGGTWWENIYPGCRLDTPNFAYSYSFAQKPDWPEQFSRQSQIEDYLCNVASEFDLRPRIQFSTTVVEATLDEADLTWQLTTQSEDGTRQHHRFHAIITAVGQLNLPNIPDIPGAEVFAGRAFHSSRWDPTVEVSGKKVAVIGTGASAYQIVPSIVDDVEQLTVFQRNAPWMLPTPGYHDTLPDGMRWLLRHIPYYGRCYRFWQFWLAAEGRLPFVTADPDWTEPGSTSAANARLRRDLLESLHSQVGDRPDLLAKMTPSYPPGAKRMTRDNGVWAAALRQPHVHLETSGIDRITREGIVDANGTLHEADIIVYATGFRASDYLEPIAVRGLEGRDLHRTWNGDARAYMGITVPGFPNLFMLMGPNTGVVVNGSSLYMAECAAEYTMECVGALLRRGYKAMDPRREAMEEFCARVDAGNKLRAWGVADVHTWYRNSHGRASQVWPFSLTEFYRLTREPDLSAYRLWDEDGAGESP